MDELLNLIPKFFGDLEITYLDDTIYIGECLIIGLEIDDLSNYYIYVYSISKCNISGTHSLKLLDELLPMIPSIKYITLYDQSYIKIRKISISLAMIFMMSEGKTWYNKLGYYQNTYIEDKKNWDEINNMNFYDVIKISFTYSRSGKLYYSLDRIYHLMNSSFSDSEKKSLDFYLNFFINFIFEKWLVYYDDVITVSDAGRLIKERLKYDINDENLYLNYVIIILMSPLYKYDDGKLLKKILHS